MADGFVWFHNGSKKVSDSAGFYQKLLGWKPAPGPAGLTMLSGESSPFAAVAAEEGIVGWIPFAEVEDVDRSTTQAEELGAKVLKPKSRGPAGEFTILQDPGGAAVALWQRA